MERPQIEIQVATRERQMDTTSDFRARTFAACAMPNVPSEICAAWASTMNSGPRTCQAENRISKGPGANRSQQPPVYLDKL